MTAPIRTASGMSASDFYAGLAAALLHGSPLPVDPREALEAIAIIESVHDRMTA